MLSQLFDYEGDRRMCLRQDDAEEDPDYEAPFNENKPLVVDPFLNPRPTVPSKK